MHSRTWWQRRLRDDACCAHNSALSEAQQDQIFKIRAGGAIKRPALLREHINAAAQNPAKICGSSRGPTSSTMRGRAAADAQVHSHCSPRRWPLMRSTEHEPSLRRCSLPSSARIWTDARKTEHREKKERNIAANGRKEALRMISAHALALIYSLPLPRRRSPRRRTPPRWRCGQGRRQGQRGPMIRSRLLNDRVKTKSRELEHTSDDTNSTKRNIKNTRSSRLIKKKKKKKNKGPSEQ